MGTSRTTPVQVLGAIFLTAGLAVGWLLGTVRAARAADWADLRRTQAAGWLELRQDQRLYRERIGPPGRGLSPEAAANLSLMEHQEELDRRALDRREAQWLDDARRRERLSGRIVPTPAPALRSRIERAEASERLRRDLRRHTYAPPPGMATTPTPTPFRLR